MTSLDAMRTLRQAGYTVKFEHGHYTVTIGNVTIGKACISRLDKLELVKLAQDLMFLS